MVAVVVGRLWVVAVVGVQWIPWHGAWEKRVAESDVWQHRTRVQGAKIRGGWELSRVMGGPDEYEICMVYPNGVGERGMTCGLEARPACFLLAAIGAGGSRGAMFGAATASALVDAAPLTGRANATSKA